MLASVNGALVVLTDALLKPLAGLPPFVSLLLLSLLTAAAVVPVFARLSNQSRLRRTKRQIHAALFEIRLFNDDPRAVLRAVGDALRYNATYLRLFLVPLAFVGGPLFLFVAHLNAFYGYGGLRPASPALLTLERHGPHPAGREPAISLAVPDPIRVETGPLHFSGEREVVWRIVPFEPGDFVVAIRIDEHLVEKTVHVSHQVSRRSPARVRAGVMTQLMNPSEQPLDAGDATSAVTINYPEATVEVAGTRLHWMIVYFVLMMAWVLLLARVFGITL